MLEKKSLLIEGTNHAWLISCILMRVKRFQTRQLAYLRNLIPYQRHLITIFKGRYMVVKLMDTKANMGILEIQSRHQG